MAAVTMTTIPSRPCWSCSAEQLEKGVTWALRRDADDHGRAMSDTERCAGVPLS